MTMSEENIIELLCECTLFRGMSYGEVSRALNGHMRRIKKYSSHVLIAQAGDKIDSLQILLQGSVKGEMIDYTGKVIKIEDIFPPRPLAPAFLFGSQNGYPVNITTVEEVTLLSIPRDSFLVMLQESEKVLVNFVNILSSRGQFLSNKIKFLSFTTIKGKLAQYLLDLSTYAGSGSFELSHSQSQLSELFGVTRPSIGRAISEMKQDGIFHTEGKRVVILDHSGLTSYLK
jgi:CRP/FNR family transcriptional regulator, dissimilatory nitrate respiration regulator